VGRPKRGSDVPYVRVKRRRLEGSPRRLFDDLMRIKGTKIRLHPPPSNHFRGLKPEGGPPQPRPVHVFVYHQ